MSKKESYQQIRVNQINQQNINVIKKFFIFNNKELQKNQHTILEKSFSNNNSINNFQYGTNLKLPMGAAKYAIRKKQKNISNNSNCSAKYAVGIFQKNDYYKEKDQQDKLFQQTKIILQSKRAPQTQLTSFLLGINNRISRQHKNRFQIRFDDQSSTNDTINNDLQPIKQDSKLYKTSPSKSSNSKYKQIMDKVNAIKDKSYIQSSISKLTQLGYKFQLNGSSQSPLPALQKRSTHNPNRNQSQINNYNIKEKMSQRDLKLSIQLTDLKIVQYDSVSIQKRKANNENIIKYNQNNQQNQARSVSPRKTEKPQKIFQKGYLYYDPIASTFLEKYQQNLQKQLLIKKSIPSITAKSYFVLNANNMIPLVGKNHKNVQPIQIASLTKIMTCYLCIIACKKYQVDMDQYTTRVSDRASQMPGTSAQLQAGDVLSIKQLLYGLMLPSGNDASVAIAETIGRIIQKYKKKPTRKTPYQTFINHMNIISRQMKMQQIFQNPSGLPLNPNFSTPQSICVLSSIACKNAIFNKVINTKQYEFQIKNQRFGLTRKVGWKNTNKLLWKDWQGIKTGTTQTAGHCLISKKDQYIISVFDCQTLNKRFIQCNKIYEFLMEENVTGLLKIQTQKYKKQQQQLKTPRIKNRKDSNISNSSICLQLYNLQQKQQLKNKNNDQRYKKKDIIKENQDSCQNLKIKYNYDNVSTQIFLKYKNNHKKQSIKSSQSRSQQYKTL